MITFVDVYFSVQDKMVHLEQETLLESCHHHPAGTTNSLGLPLHE